VSFQFFSTPSRLTFVYSPSNNLSGNRLNPVLNSEGKDDKNHTRVFRSHDIHEHSDIQLTRGGLILVGLMSGGDYEGGLERCGVTTAHAIAHCGFGDALFDAAHDLSREGLVSFIDTWRQEVRLELQTNSRGFLARKAISLAKSMPDTFPNIDVLLSYVNPVTSESLGHEGSNPKITWSKELDIAAVASACELFFEWGYEEAIVKRFRSVIWPGAVLRTFRRAILDMDRNSTSPAEYQPKRTHPNRNEGIGTPSKMIVQRISAIDLNDSDSETDSERTREQNLIVCISRERTHVSTDGLPEYRLEVAPAQLVNSAISGLRGLRQPEGPNEWASDEDETDQEEDEEEKCRRRGKAKEPVDPRTHIRLWIPVCMVEPVEEGLVSDFRDVQERRKQKRVPAKQRKPASSQSKPYIHEMIPATPSKNKKQEMREVFGSLASNGQSNTVTTLDANSGATFVPGSSVITEGLLSKKPSRQPRHKHKTRKELLNKSIPAPTDRVKTLVTAPTKKSSTRTITLSKAAEVAAIFSDSAPIAVPSTRAIESTLTLTDSDDELTMDMYRSIRPNKSFRPVAPEATPDYLSLSDDDNPFIAPPSPDQMSNKQTKISTYMGEECKMSADSQNEKLSRPPLTKSPRKAKLHMSPRNTGKGAKECSSVIEISDESDSGYCGVSQPVLDPLRLGLTQHRDHASSQSIPSVICDVIDLT